jgi:hypothetical protein
LIDDEKKNKSSVDIDADERKPAARSTRSKMSKANHEVDDERKPAARSTRSNQSTSVQDSPSSTGQHDLPPGVHPAYQYPSSSDESLNNFHCTMENEDSDTDKTKNSESSDDNLHNEGNFEQSKVLPDSDQNIEGPIQEETQWRDYQAPYTSSMFAETKLLKILDDANASHYLFEDIINWASESQHHEYNFLPSTTNRKGLIKQMEKKTKFAILLAKTATCYF